MSHVTAVDIQITDLEALARAADALGLELVRDQKTFKWYGTHVGDYPLPAGFKKEDMGRCAHALRVRDNAGAYEVGVVERRDGKPGFQLLWDFWAGGRGLQAKVGQDCSKLRAEYGAQVAIRQANKLGYRHNLTRRADGQVEKLSIYR